MSDCGDGKTAVAAQHQDASAWVAEIDALWAFLDDAGQPIADPTRAFVTTILRVRAVSEPAGFRRDARVENKLRAREGRLKRRACAADRPRRA